MIISVSRMIPKPRGPHKNQELDSPSVNPITLTEEMEGAILKTVRCKTFIEKLFNPNDSTR